MYERMIKCMYVVCIKIYNLICGFVGLVDMWACGTCGLVDMWTYGTCGILGLVG